MKRIILIFIAVLTASFAWAGTPAEDVVEMYKDVNGARNLVARGAMIRMARPLMRNYSIAPLAHKVDEISVLRMDKVKSQVKDCFLSEMRKALEAYMYAGQSDTPNGIVDAYVHLSSSDVADELVVYNPEIFTLYSLKGEFTVQELLSIQKKP